MNSSTTDYGGEQRGRDGIEGQLRSFRWVQRQRRMMRRKYGAELRPGYGASVRTNGESERERRLDTDSSRVGN